MMKKIKMLCVIFSIMCLMIPLGFTYNVSAKEEKLNTISEEEISYKPVITGEWKTLFEPSIPGPKKYMNDHTIIKGTDDKWHIIGINGNENGLYNEVSFAHGESDELLGDYQYAKANPLCAFTDEEGRPYDAWAPHAIRVDEKIYLFYRTNTVATSTVPSKMALVTTTDMVHWEKEEINPDVPVWREWRDPMILKVDDTYIMYATDYDKNNRSAISMYESKDLHNWTFTGYALTSSGAAQNVDWSAAESPFVVKKGNQYYLSVTFQPTGTKYYHNTVVFESKDPRNFGHYDGNNESSATANVVTTLPVHAPEFIEDPDTGKWYITTAGWPGYSIYPEAEHGVAIAEIEWQKVEKKQWDTLRKVPQDGLMAWYAFDDMGGNVIHDSSNNENHADIQGRTFFSEKGKSNGSMFFYRPSDAYANLKEPIVLEGDFSIGGYIYTPDTPSNKHVMMGSKQQNFNFYQQKATLHDNGVNRIIALDSISAREWAHVMVTRENGILKIYINGKLSNTSKNEWRDTFIIETIGKGVGEANFSTLDDVVIYNRALSEKEIVDIKNLPSDGVNKEALREKIEEASNILPENYTEDSYKMLQEAIAKGKVIMQDDKVTQEDVNNQIVAIDTAIKQLIAIVEIIDDTDVRWKYSLGGANNGGWDSWSDGSGNPEITEHWSNTPGAEITLSFTGTKLELYGKKHPGHAMFSVSIDGNEAVEVDSYAKEEQKVALLYESDALENMAHTATITVLNKRHPDCIETGGIYGIQFTHAKVQLIDEKVDKSLLIEVIKEAEVFIKDNYTPNSWEILSEALSNAKAVNNDDNATQEEVNEALATLNTAIKNLEYKKADYTKVDEAIEKAEAKLEEDIYTEASVKAVEDAINAVVRDLNITKQGEVDAMAEAINDAVDALEKKPVEEPVDKEALSEVIDEANALDLDLYTKESVEALLEALKYAGEVNADEKATQEEVDNALAKLTTAIDGLQPVEPTTPEEDNKPNEDGEGPDSGDSTNVGGLLTLLGLAGIAIAHETRKRMR